MVENPPECLPDTPPVRLGPKARKITMADAEAIAELVAYRLTETEACLHIGIEPARWWLWKNRKRNTPEFEKLTTRLRAAKLAGCLKEIGKAATGADGIRHDWRAAKELMAMASPDRYGNAALGQPSANNTLNTALLGAITCSVWSVAGPVREPEQIIDVQAKQIPAKCANVCDSKPDDNPGDYAI